MKKWILLAIVSITGLNVLNAQNFQQGDKAIAARVSNLDLNFIKWDGENTGVNINFGLMGDYFLIDNLALTAGFDFNYARNAQKRVEKSLLGEIGCKYYFWKYIYGGVFYQGFYDLARLNNRGKVEIGATCYIADNVFITPAIYFLRGEHAFSTKNVEMYSQFGLSVSFGVNF